MGSIAVRELFCGQYCYCYCGMLLTDNFMYVKHDRIEGIALWSVIYMHVVVVIGRHTERPCVVAKFTVMYSGFM